MSIHTHIRQKDKYTTRGGFLRISSYCTAFSYDLDKLYKVLEKENKNPLVYEGVIHIKKKIEEDPNGGDIFYFPYGCVILWGFSFEDTQKELKFLKKFHIKDNSRDFHDILNYKYNSTDTAEIAAEDDAIILPQNENTLTKLSFSYALSQSTKLQTVEESGLETIKRSQFLVDELISTGKISISQKKLTKKIGILFAERNAMNMHADILDTPEFFWRRPKYLPLYKDCADFLDIAIRTEIVNRRSNVVHELFYLLSVELQYLQSNRLEWIVIALIAMEVVISIGSIAAKALGYS